MWAKYINMWDFSYFLYHCTQYSVGQNWQFLRDLILDCMEKSPRRMPQAVRTYRGWRGLSSDLSGENSVQTTEPRSPTKTETGRCSGSSGRRLRVPWRQPTGTTWTHCSRKMAEATKASGDIWRAHGKTCAESVPLYRMEGSPVTLRTRLTCWIISSAQSSLEKIAWTFRPRWNLRTPRCPGSLYQVQESSSFSANSTPGKPQDLTTSLRFFLKTCAWELASMLAFIMQQSLTTIRIPSDWKKALVWDPFSRRVINRSLRTTGWYRWLPSVVRSQNTSSSHRQWSTWTTTAFSLTSNMVSDDDVPVNRNWSSHHTTWQPS